MSNYFSTSLLGFLTTRMTESPLKNSLLMYLSLLTGLTFLPFFFLGISDHISHTFSRTMFKCLSNALTLASNFRLFLQLTSICQLVFTALVIKLKGPSISVSSCGICFRASSADIPSPFLAAMI